MHVLKSFLRISKLCCFIMMGRQLNGTNLNGQRKQSMLLPANKQNDLGVEHFNADRYIELVKKHGLEISQPGLGPNDVVTWEMTRRREDQEVHKVSLERPGWCSDQHLPPCAAFVEIMAPVFSREAWRCVWYMIQNDLVHGWGLDFALRRCVEPAHEKIGVVDSEWIIHKVIPSLVNQGVTKFEKSRRQEVRIRCKSELSIFQDRLANADMAYHAQFGNG
ncbi:hypothetical protein V6Z12_A13G269800 [Gossypium hirsutum]